MKFKKFAISVCGRLGIAYPQNNQTKNFLKKFQVKKIKVLGNLKLIENTGDKKDDICSILSSQFKKYKLWTAASTHKGEEIFCAKTHIQLKKKVKNLLTIIIPRHIDRVDEIASEMNKLNLNVAKHSSNLKYLKNIDIYIVDTFGETKKFFKISNSVFVGGTLANKGGQNHLRLLDMVQKFTWTKYPKFSRCF